MTRSGSTKAADVSHGFNRLTIARAFLESAQNQVTIAQSGTLGNPIAATIVNAAIAYTDALTAAFGNKINQQDHSAVVKTLRQVMGNRLPKAQETRLSRILGNKDLAQYGGRFMLLAEAQSLLSQLEEYATWAESELVRA